MNEKNNLDGRERKEELDSITSEKIHFFYELKEENKTSCSVAYDSADFEQGETQTIKVSPLPLNW